MLRGRSSQQCCVLNGGGGAWAFEPLATQLSSFLGVEVSNAPRQFNYLLNFDDTDALAHERFFIPLEAIFLASDKRLLSVVLSKQSVPTPETHLFENFKEASRFVRVNPGKKWCLKYPTGCGASGHRMLHADSSQPPNWPTPFIVQEFIQLERPEVYRIFCAAGEMFGWLARRFPDGGQTSPWVAHARGARYVRLGQAPSEAVSAAQRALT
jgi:glutathione synthase/RimK-type ligase-like ATP-grasp enzyme